MQIHRNNYFQITQITLSVVSLENLWTLDYCLDKIIQLGFGEIVL